MKTSFLYSAAVLALAPAAAQAAATITELDAVVITASRAPERADQVGGQITVLDRLAIEAAQAPVVSDLLARTPGIDVSRNGGVGAATQLRIRGAETDQTVVLFDGVKLNDPSAIGAGYNFANLLTGDVSRIEVLRGAQSVLWGSQAIGGVVNMITADAEAPLEGRVEAEAGAQSTAYVRGSVGGRGERLTWRTSAGWFTSGGISSFARALGGRERDGYRNATASAKAKVTLSEQLYLDLRGYYSRGRNQFDGFPAPAFVFADTAEYGVTRDWIGYAGLNLDLLDGRLSNRLAYARTQTDRDNFNPAQSGTTRTFDSAGHNQRLEYEGTWRFAEAWTAVFGAERERSAMRTASPSSFNPTPVPGRRKASLDSLYGQLKGEVVPGLTLGAGVRADDHGDFGRHTVGQASAAWRLNDGATVLRASVGEGFKAPSLYQLGSEYGNAGLQPESATSWDAGVEQRLADDRLVLSGAWFHRKTTDQIDFVSCSGTSVAPLCFGAGGARRFGYYDNIARTTARGVELQVEAKPTEALAFSANYTWTRARNAASASPSFGKRLARRPAQQAYAEASWRWPAGVTTAAAVKYVGVSFDDAANRVRVKGYTLVDLRANWPVSDAVELYGRVENLFDRRYQTLRNYGAPGRSAFAGVRARF